jgi:hypothetical protein
MPFESFREARPMLFDGRTRIYAVVSHVPGFSFFRSQDLNHRAFALIGIAFSSLNFSLRYNQVKSLIKTSRLVTMEGLAWSVSTRLKITGELHSPADKNT